MKKGCARRLLRRGGALCCALGAMTVVGLTCDVQGACAQLGESSQLLWALLHAEMGDTVESDGLWQQMSALQRLSLSQTSLLSRVQQEEESGEEQTGEEQQQEEEQEQAQSSTVQQEGEDDEEAQPETTAGQVEERTLLASEGGGYLSALGVSLYNYTSQELDVETLAAAEIALEPEEGEGPQILIIHTHGSEAYTMDGEDVYQQSDSYRTTDTQYNVVRVGDEMEQVFEGLGLTVLHDRTLYDYPQYDGAYGRAAAAISDWLEQYPTIQIVLDVHRDALAESDGTVYKTVAQVEGDSTAQVMLVLGTDDNLTHPNWRNNLALAIRIQQELDGAWPTLARPISLRSARFNQQLTYGSLLVEVGSHGSPRQGARPAAGLFAQAGGVVFVERLGGEG
ncbi:MAG: stage II sporulation protein P [Oscillospiraceae bacterium]|nr:stage II sporulation protein P [Oscillospiraceae bacterium]